MRRCGVVGIVLLTMMLATTSMLWARSVSAQDVIVLKDGRKFTGTIEWESTSHLGVKTDFGLVQFDRSSIRDVFTRKKNVPGKSTSAGSGIMNLAGPETERSEPEETRARKAGQVPAASGVSASSSRPPDDSRSEQTGGRQVTEENSHRGTTGGSGEAAGSKVVAWSADERIGRFVDTLRERLGPFFPQQVSTRILLVFLLFGLTLGLVQVGCRFMDLESFSLGRGFLFNIVLVLLLVAGFSLRDHLAGPLQVVLGILAGFVILAAAATVLFHARAGKSTLLVAFVLVAGSTCLVCITVGAVGVVNIY
jgi:hypothetical protein